MVKSLYVTMLADTNSDGSQKGASYIVKYDLNQTKDSLLTQSRNRGRQQQYAAVRVDSDWARRAALRSNQRQQLARND